MAKDSLPFGHSVVNPRHHVTHASDVRTLLSRLETARSWCECLIRHDFSSIEICPEVLRQHLFALSEALEQAYEIGDILYNMNNIVALRPDGPT